MTVNSGREMALLCPRARALPVPRQCLWGSNLSSLGRGAGAEPPEPRLRPLCYSGTLGGESWPRAGGWCCSPCSLGAGFRSAARAKAGGELRGSAGRGGASTPAAAGAAGPALAADTGHHTAVCALLFFFFCDLVFDQGPASLCAGLLGGDSFIDLNGQMGTGGRFSVQSA